VTRFQCDQELEQEEERKHKKDVGHSITENCGHSLVGYSGTHEILTTNFHTTLFQLKHIVIF
jgi:hypothetical protein